MSDRFDPYYKWLGIPPAEQPPNHYRLLGVTLFEADADVIANAADQRIVHVKAFQIGKHSDESQRILREISAARVCLLNAERKSEYDARLRAASATPTGPSAAAAELATRPAAISAGRRHGLRTPKPIWMVLAGILTTAIAAVVFLIGHLSSGDKDGPQSAARLSTVEPVLSEPPMPATDASVGSDEPAAADGVIQSTAGLPADQEPRAPAPSDQPPTMESQAVPDPALGEAEKTVSDKESEPAVAEPGPAAAGETVSSPSPSPENGLPAPAETLEQAEQRLNAALEQATAAEEQQAVAGEALKLADRAILDSQAALARRLAVLAMKAARKSNSLDRLGDAALLINDLREPISESLRDKARQRLGQE